MNTIQDENVSGPLINTIPGKNSINNQSASKQIIYIMDIGAKEVIYLDYPDLILLTNGDNMVFVSDKNDVKIHFIDLLPIPEIPKKNKRSESSEVLTSTSYKQQLIEKKKRKDEKIKKKMEKVGKNSINMKIVKT